MIVLISDSSLRMVEQGILGLLLSMGLSCLVLFFWRWRAIGLANVGITKWRTRLFENLAEELSSDEHAPRQAKAESEVADRLVRLGLNNSLLCPAALEKLLESFEIRERHLMERGTLFIGTVAANAPFLGLTGTVLGILSAFRRMATQGGTGSVEVMSAIAGALIATAVGLLVAIPAVVLFNLLKARLRKSMHGLGEIRNLLLARSLQSVAKETF